MNPATSSALVARLRSGKFATPDDLALAIVAAVAGVEKHQSSRRGLEQGQLVDKDGGTLISVTDQSASRQSISLQYPQFMLRRNAGGAISTRVQRRADINTRTVPAMVIAVNGDGADATLTVALLAATPAVTQDDQTNQNKPADPLSGIYNDPADQGGQQFTIPMSGTPFAGVGGADTGTKIPAVGATVEVILSDETEKRTIHHRRGGINSPRVLNYPGASGAALVNGFCCTETGNPPGGT